MLAGVGGGSAAALLTRHHSAGSGLSASPAAVWAPGVRPAPAFRLHDQQLEPVSLRSLRGRTVLLTFIDPLCRNLCPLEAKVLSDALRRLPAATRPTVVAVSVNPWGDDRSSLALDRQHWQLAPGWRWAIGSRSDLAAVWRKYGISVFVSTKTLAGATVHEIAHTEGSYLIDASGDERALFLYPFTEEAVLTAVRGVQAGGGT